MKRLVFKSAFTVAILFTIGALTSFSSKPAFDSAKWNKGPFLSGLTISGVATGLGTGPYALLVSGFYDCVNNGTQVPGSDNWSTLSVIVPVAPKANGGNFKLSATIPSQCIHANWGFLVRNLRVTLLQNNITVIQATDVIQQ